MTTFTVRCKASVYYDVEIESNDMWDAQDQGFSKFSELLDSCPALPSPLEFEGSEVWEIEEKEKSHEPASN